MLDADPIAPGALHHQQTRMRQARSISTKGNGGTRLMLLEEKMVQCVAARSTPPLAGL